MINNVVLVGRVTKDPELRYTPSNVAVATFTLAVNRTFKTKDGEREADFINCVIWRQPAENLANWAKKGALIGVTGRIQTRNYEKQQGQRVYVTEIVADSFQMLENRKESQGQEQAQSHQQNAPRQQQANQNNNANSGNYQSPFDTQNNSPFGNSNPMDISDDDLPF